MTWINQQYLDSTASFWCIYGLSSSRLFKGSAELSGFRFIRGIHSPVSRRGGYGQGGLGAQPRKTL